MRNWQTWTVGLCLLAAGCSEEASDGGGGSGGSGGSSPNGGGPSAEYAVLVRGELFTTDLDEAQTLHDMLASGGEEAAKEAGDFGHDALLGTDILGTTPNEFLGLDRWNDLAGLEAFYADPAFQEAFGMLFAAPPTVEVFAHQPEWHGWGSLTAGDPHDPYFFVVVRGRLADEPAASQAKHDAVAAGGEMDAKALGDVAHVVFTGVADSREFLAIDVWSASDGIAALYGDPAFQEAFATLFEAPPSLGVYQSTSWHQW